MNKTRRDPTDAPPASSPYEPKNRAIRRAQRGAGDGPHNLDQQVANRAAWQRPRSSKQPRARR